MLKSQFKSFDDKEISYLFFESKRTEIKKNVLLIHGMMETKERYGEFSEFLANNGYNVYIFDLRGHGDFSEDKKPIYFEKGETAYTILEDMKFFIENIINTRRIKKSMVLTWGFISFIFIDYFTLKADFHLQLHLLDLGQPELWFHVYAHLCDLEGSK